MMEPTNSSNESKEIQEETRERNGSLLESLKNHEKSLDDALKALNERYKKIIQEGLRGWEFLSFLKIFQELVADKELQNMSVEIKDKFLDCLDSEENFIGRINSKIYDQYGSLTFSIPIFNDSNFVEKFIEQLRKEFVFEVGQFLDSYIQKYSIKNFEEFSKIIFTNNFDKKFIAYGLDKNISYDTLYFCYQYYNNIQNIVSPNDEQEVKSDKLLAEGKEEQTIEKITKFDQKFRKIELEIYDIEEKNEINAELWNYISEKNIQDWEIHWKSNNLEFIAKFNEAFHWDWGMKVFNAKLKNLTQLKKQFGLYSIICKNMTQGLMIIRFDQKSKVDSSKGLVYVDYIEVAPWNFRNVNQKFKRVGSSLIKHAIDVSGEIGFEGRLGLHSLPQSESFYVKMGMTDYGVDPEKGNLRYFEM